MGILYVVKEFGRYHFFKDEDKRTEFIQSLTEWEQKAAETYEVRFGKAVE